MIKINQSVSLTPDMVLDLISSHLNLEAIRFNKLEKYYLAKNDINNRVMTDISKPNNKIANAYASYITDTLVGYFIGIPITYLTNNKEELQQLQKILDYNDEADENTELAKNASIYGIAYERLYIDLEGNVKFKALKPIECIPIFDDTIENTLLYFIRYYKNHDIVNDEDFYSIELIDKDNIYIYKANINLTSMILIEQTTHYFGDVPIVIYHNNEEDMGDFERVISLIDAYDKLESDSLNDFEYFVDAYLALYGFTAEPQEIIEMKQKRVLLMDEGTNAEWLTKNTADTHIENMKSRLDNDIHKFSFCPNMSDENFANNASGISIKYKLLNTENLIAIKERKFKRGLQQRLKLLSAIQGLLASSFDYMNINFIFTRNIPANTLDIAEMVNKLSNIASRETLLSQLPFVDNVQEEMERINNEKETNPFFQQRLEYLTGAMNRGNERTSDEGNQQSTES